MFMITQSRKQHKPNPLSWCVKQTMHLSAIASLAVSSSMIHAEVSQQPINDNGIEINRGDNRSEPSTTLPTIVVMAETNKQVTENTDSYTITVTSSATGMGLSRSEEHTSELQSRENLVCRLLLEKKKLSHSTSERIS